MDANKDQLPKIAYITNRIYLQYTYLNQIPISDLNKKFTDLSPKWADSRIKPILEFLKQNNQEEINFQDIDYHLNYIFDNFLREITLKLREVQNYLNQQLKLLAQNALKNVQYLKQRVNKIYDLEELGSVLQKYIQGTYSKETFEQIIKDYSSNIQGNTEIENIYNYITKDGVNHNYLDIIQIDLQGFHIFKSRILSHFARIKDFDTYLPKQYTQLPTKTHASFSWNIIKNNRIPKQASLSIHQFKSKILCIINHEKIVKYSHSFKYLGIVHKCQDDFYISTFVDSSLQLLVLWSQPTYIQMYQDFRKVRIIKNASLNPISQMLFINKYNLFASGLETCILTLDSNGILKLNPLSNNYLYDFTYGSGIIEVMILPESKQIKQSLTFDGVFDLVVCSYQKNQVKLAIRSLFSPSPLSRIWDDETLESKLGLLEHCQVYFTIVELSQHEKIHLKKHMDVEGIDYAIITLLNNIVSFWNWKTGKAFKVIDAIESYGIRDMPSVVNGSLLNLVILIGLDGNVCCVNWMKGAVATYKLRIQTGLQIHAMSQQLSKLGSQQFIVILRHIKQPYMTVTQLMYY